MLKIENLSEEIPVYDITVEGTHNFFANGILIHNCTEILEPTKPINHIDSEDGEIALCTLSSFNVGIIKSEKELEVLSDLAIRFLDELIDTQYYPVKAAEIPTRARRMLGIGVIGLAHYFAKLNVSYEEQAAWDATHRLSESIQYYLLKASNNLAKEKGACEYFDRTKYSEGILPIDTYKKDVDEICNVPLQHDWESLRADILQYGLRNSTCSTILPSESCLFWEHKIRTLDGYMNFHQIAEIGGVDWKKLEENDLVGWYDLNTPIQVETQSGYIAVDKLYFNGNKEVVTLSLENGKVIKCTPNHRFLIKQEDGSTVWKRVYQLTEGDDIVEF
jgi:hypothetical protein